MVNDDFLGQVPLFLAASLGPDCCDANCLACLAALSPGASLRRCPCSVPGFCFVFVQVRIPFSTLDRDSNEVQETVRLACVCFIALSNASWIALSSLPGLDRRACRSGSCPKPGRTHALLLAAIGCSGRFRHAHVRPRTARRQEGDPLSLQHVSELPMVTLFVVADVRCGSAVFNSVIRLSDHFEIIN